MKKYSTVICDKKKGCNYFWRKKSPSPKNGYKIPPKKFFLFSARTVISHLFITILYYGYYFQIKFIVNELRLYSDLAVKSQKSRVQWREAPFSPTSTF